MWCFLFVPCRTREVVARMQKKHCDYLVVALSKAKHIDSTINSGKLKPLYLLEERTLIMQSCRYVDEVVIYNSKLELLNILRKGNFDIRFLVEDYRSKKITGKVLPIEFFYNHRGHGLSTSGYLKKIHGKK
jgi:glycerol-3-phosphate cytidylyltransferase